MKQPPINVRLPDDLAEKYRRISHEKDLPVSVLLRWAATVYMSGIESGKIVLQPFGDPSEQEEAKPTQIINDSIEDPAKLAAAKAKAAAKQAKALPRAQTGS